MRVFGSLNNRMMEDAKPPVPEVGMGVTILMYTDRVAATITWVSKSGKTITIQRDNEIRTDSNGQSESQEYTYTPNPNGQLTTVSLRKDGRWKEAKSTTVVRLGVRDSYYDYGF